MVTSIAAGSDNVTTESQVILLPSDNKSVQMSLEFVG